MDNKNKKSFNDSEPTPEIVRRFYSALRENGNDATSGSNPKLFQTLDAVCHNVDLPQGVTVGKYWAGYCKNIAPTPDAPELLAIAALALGEVAEPTAINTGAGSASVPVGMIELTSSHDARVTQDYESSYFTLFQDGTLTLEGKVGMLGDELHGDYLNDIVPALPTSVRQLDMGIEPTALNEEQKGELIRVLEESMSLQQSSEDEA